jgi:hypothetical protein
MVCPLIEPPDEDEPPPPPPPPLLPQAETIKAVANAAAIEVSRR